MKQHDPEAELLTGRKQNVLKEQLRVLKSKYANNNNENENDNEKIDHIHKTWQLRENYHFRISPYSVRILEIRTRITPNTDTFHVVYKYKLIIWYH